MRCCSGSTAPGPGVWAPGTGRPISPGKGGPSGGIPDPAGGGAGMSGGGGGGGGGGGFVLGVVGLRPTASLAVSLIESPDQRPSDCDGRNTCETGQHFTGEPHDRRPFAAQAQRGDGLLALS